MLTFKKKKIPLAVEHAAADYVTRLLEKPKPKVAAPDRVFWDLKKDGVTQSLLMEFLACRKRAELAYREGWSTSETSNALTFGSLFHGSLERVYRYMQQGIKEIKVDNVIKNVLDEYKKLVSAERVWLPADEENHILNTGYLNILLPYYLKVYGKKDAKRTWIHVEDEFMNEYTLEYPTVGASHFESIIMRGKFDAVFKNKHGETWVKETKTKYIIDPAIADRLEFDPQVNIYILNYQLKHPEQPLPVGFEYDMIQRPRLRKGANETLQHFMDRVRGDVDESYFVRIRMRIDADKFSFWRDHELASMLKEFKEWAEGKLPTYRNPASCETRYGTCKFLRVCGLGDYTGLYQRRDVFPELATDLHE